MRRFFGWASRGKRFLVPTRARPRVVLLGSLTAFGPLATDMYLPAFPRIAADFGVPVGTVQLTLALFLAGLAAGQLVFGPLSDRLGRRRPLLAGCLLYVLAAVLCARAETIGGLVAARFLMGLGGSAGQVIARATVRDICDEKGAARMFSLMMLVTAAAPILAPVLGSGFLAWGNWHGIFWVQAAFGLACAAAAAVDLPETHPPHRRSRAHAGWVALRYLRLLGDRRFIGFAVAGGFSSGILFTYISGAPFVFMELHHVPPGTFSVLFGLNAASLFATAQLNRPLHRRFSARQIVRGAFTVNLAAGAWLVVLAATGWGGFPLFAISILPVMGTIGLIGPNLTALTLRSFSRKAGTVSALMGTASFLMAAGAGALGGLLNHGSAVPWALTLAAGGLGGLLALGAGTKRPPAAAPGAVSRAGAVR